MNKADQQALEAAYRAAQREIDETVGPGVARINQEAAAKGHFNSGGTAKRIVDLKKAALAKAVEVLIQAHQQAGSADQGDVTRRIEAFLRAQTVDHDLRAHSQHTQEVGQQEFTSVMARLVAALPDQVAVALLQQRSKTTMLERLKKRAGNRPMLVGAAVVLILIGVVRTVIGLIHDVKP